MKLNECWRKHGRRKTWCSITTRRQHQRTNSVEQKQKTNDFLSPRFGRRTAPRVFSRLRWATRRPRRRTLRRRRRTAGRRRSQPCPASWTAWPEIQSMIIESITSGSSRCRTLTNGNSLWSSSSSANPVKKSTMSGDRRSSFTATLAAGKK